jgi:hypothetical protein
MKTLLIAALSAAIGLTAAGTTAFAQATVTGAPRGAAPATTEGYGPSSVVVCNGAGYCWHAEQGYDYPRAPKLTFMPTTGCGTTAIASPGASIPAAAIGKGMSGRSFGRTEKGGGLRAAL